MLDAIERENASSLRRALFDGESAAAQYSGGERVFAYHYDEAERHYNEMRKLTMPYAAGKAMSDSWFKQAIKKYEMLYKDKDDDVETR